MVEGDPHTLWGEDLEHQGPVHRLKNGVGTNVTSESPWGWPLLTHSVTESFELRSPQMAIIQEKIERDVETGDWGSVFCAPEWGHVSSMQTPT